MSAIAEVKSEERLIPLIRARLAMDLFAQGFHVKEIAEALRVTQPAVTQYIGKKRGSRLQGLETLDNLVKPLAEKLAARLRSGLGGVETAELLETAKQVLVVGRGKRFAQEPTGIVRVDRSLELLRTRLQLELAAAEKYLELANKTSDDHTKLLLRMIASDSIRHGDVVSQIMSWVEAGSQSDPVLPDPDVLGKMLSVEDSAGEVNLKANVEISHPVARLLLEWIDMDEEKHGRILKGLFRSTGRPARTKRLEIGHK